MLSVLAASNAWNSLELRREQFFWQDLRNNRVMKKGTYFACGVQAAIHGTAVFILLVLTGCGTLKSGQGWGENALYPVDWKRIPIAAKNAALDPVTFVPLIGAGVIAIGDWDHKISDWAVDHTPIFGSTDTAKDFSGIGRTILVAEGFGSALFTPSGDEAGEWALNKTRGLLVEGAAFGVMGLATDGLKSAVGRERPDESGDDSMPSGHASTSFAGAALANRNLDYIEMNRYARTSIKVANVALATSVAWARVEGEKHFPTDVLVGAALGNFTTRFIHDAFIGIEPDDKFSYYIEPSTSGARVFLSWEF